MSKSDHAVSTVCIVLWNSARIQRSSGANEVGGVSNSDGTSNCEANRATLNNLVKTPKYFFSISSGLIWKSSPTCASQAFQRRKHSLPILLARNLTEPSGPLTCHEPVRPPAPHSRTESASMPLPRDLLILRPQGSIPSPSIHTCWKPGWSKTKVDLSSV